VSVYLWGHFNNFSQGTQSTSCKEIQIFFIVRLFSKEASSTFDLNNFYLLISNQNVLSTRLVMISMQISKVFYMGCHLAPEKRSLGDTG
jgi:hypothetical protein